MTACENPHLTPPTRAPLQYLMNVDASTSTTVCLQVKQLGNKVRCFLSTFFAVGLHSLLGQGISACCKECACKSVLQALSGNLAGWGQWEGQ